MRWLADECVDASLVGWLRSAGHDVIYVAEITPSITDIDVVVRAANENRLLLTDDKDFGELVVRWGWVVPGLILLRTEAIGAQHKWGRLKAGIEHYGDRLFGRYTIVEDARIRSRPL